MKRLLFLMSLVFASWYAYGQGQEMCNRAFNHAMDLYKTSRYKEAKMQFEWCGDHCGSSYTGWIEKCNTAISQQEQAARRRRQAEIEAIKRKEAAAMERAQRIKTNHYIYFTSSSPVGIFNNNEYVIQGKIHQIDNNLRFIPDSTEAYYAVRVLINTDKRPSSPSGYRCYYFYADIEVEDLTTGVRQLLEEIRVDDCCSTEVLENQAEQCVADKIYSHNEFFQRIAEEISNYINNKPSQPNSYVGQEAHSGQPDKGGRKRTVVLVYNNCGVEDASINALRSSMTTSLLNDENKRFAVLDHSKEMDELVREEVVYSEGHVTAAEIAQIGGQKGAEWACAIVITRSNEGFLHFECKVVDVNSSEIVLQGQYTSCDYFMNHQITTVNNASAQHIARHLADEIGLLSDSQHDKLMKDDQDKRGGYSRTQTVSTICAFVPGLYQLRSDKKNDKIKGALFIAGEGLCVGSIIAAQGMRNINIKKMNSTNNADLKRMYANRADTFTTVRNVSIGAAAAVYVWNVVDAFVGMKKEKGHASLYPMVTDESVALTLSINF